MGLSTHALLVALAVVAAGLAVSFALARLHLRYWVRRLSLPVEYAATERIATDDGAAFELRRVPIAAGVARDETLPPILLVHGVAANHRNQDLHPDHSLARHLAALGRDVFLLTLRSGMRLRFRALRTARVESMAKAELPLAIDRILRRTGASAVDYVGFSMGGLLLYAALDRTIPKEKVRRVVIVGSPARMRRPWFVPRVLRFVPRIFVPHLPLRLGARTFAFLSEWFSTPIHRLVANPRNVAPGMTRLALVDVIEDMPAALNADFLRAMTGDGVLRAFGESITKRLPSMTLPALFVAGSDDRLAPPEAVRHAFDLWGADDPATVKRFVVLGREYGSKEDYGHGDLAVGANVGEELFPPIATFLGPERRAAASPDAA
jgi:polyhydroxyalkanoate synthase